MHSETVSFVYNNKNKGVGVSAGSDINGNYERQRYMTNVAANANQQNPEIPHPSIMQSEQNTENVVDMIKTKKPRNMKSNLNTICTQTENINGLIPRLEQSMIKIHVESDLREIPTTTYRYTESQIVVTEENIDNDNDKEMDRQVNNAMLHSTIIRKKCQTASQDSIRQ